MLFRLFILGLALASTASACTIPVFRFALDRWEADAFHLVLPPSVSQDAAVSDLLRPLRANGKANVSITSAPEATEAALKYSRESDHLVWSGALNAQTLPMLLDSPARQELLKKILAGDSVIWVIVEGGSQEDKAEAERIEKRLGFLEQVAALPVQNPNDPDSQLGPGPPLRLKFATLRLRRDDAAEQPLIRMLAGPEGKVDASTTSFAAAVFGRGRVLGAWPLADLDDASLEDACMFLVGRCSCRLKNENPGWDILMNVDWEKALAAVKADAPPEPVIPQEPAASNAPVTVTVTADDHVTYVAVKWPWQWTAGAVALLLSIAAVMLLRKK
ncbi:hypothetical protein EI77_01355 [Prosthecobacter fusiformis]|uniref:Uncharacterized protein n=1 Tax=Prosthecobacter fusiformis TaxID=48464 RepID=A0A4R7S4V2_9BACT|nr:hypothetical protein [Prosthecobacter fusiformis]TDU72889.1 hypothetical protein EI77_01355 [Prosthecobacter fusiformis]